ncbi:hypothetical protein GOP47_0009420 [Adiantum capillus-veneris]|uniref:Uncharacterized protein n=1 Tax=Adiantum capillus-veneris TaxID=13818 RepID=A0A9D4UWU7_ADICA|nr:hypothetical protein GOP47_0009420 [Adiantum capillus-veneris]
MPSSDTRKLASDSFSGENSSPQGASTSRYHPYSGRRHREGNVTRLLSWREVSPAVRRTFRKLWDGPTKCGTDAVGVKKHEAVNAKLALTSWVEAESLLHCSAKYCPLQPAPRSTIAAAFSPDGTVLASTHGDHTVKIICCKTGLCLKTLCGHRRTPWVVRFHPSRSDVLASGSLDNEVKIWDANTAECISSHDFYRPIASIAFHAQGDLLAVASGHKLYIWQYNRHAEDTASPSIVLRTRRSLRAVHFHPHGAPLLLTAEVNGLDAPDCPMTLASSAGYLHYPRPAIFFTPVQQPASDSGQRGNLPGLNADAALPAPAWIWPAAWVSDNNYGAVQMDNEMMDSNGVQQTPLPDTDTFLPESDTLEFSGFNSEAVPMDASPRPAQGDIQAETYINESSFHLSYLPEASNAMESGVDMLLRAAEGQAFTEGQGSRNPVSSGVENVYPNLTRVLPRSETRDSLLGVNLPSNVSEGPVDAAGIWPNSGIWNDVNIQVLVGDNMPAMSQSPFQVGESSGWELPFLQGWVMGQTQAGMAQPNLQAPQHGILVVPSIPFESRGLQHQHRHGLTGISGAARNLPRTGNSRASRSRGAGHRGLATSGPGGPGSVHVGVLHGFASRDPNLGMIAADTSTMAAAAAAAELPCTVKLRIWPHDIKNPSAVLDPGRCRLTIPHAVLCSEMGAHFSPCGRFLAACVACVLPPADSEALVFLRNPSNEASLSSSPTRHSMSAQQVIYELRIYSLEEATFGEELASRAIRAAHCLTSIQFSPASDHILLAYGRRHSSLLRSLIINGTTTIPIFTILEIYRVSDMELVKVLPSAEDEVNVACFHPVVGGGLAYGTKEGRLRIFKPERLDPVTGSTRPFEDHVFDVG